MDGGRGGILATYSRDDQINTYTKDNGGRFLTAGKGLPNRAGEKTRANPANWTQQYWCKLTCFNINQ